VKRFTKPLLTAGGLVLIVSVCTWLVLRGRPSSEVDIIPNRATNEIPALSHSTPNRADSSTTAENALEFSNTKSLTNRSQDMIQESTTSVLAQDPFMATQAAGSAIRTNSSPGFIPLIESPVAKNWMRNEGYSREDIAMAQNRLRKGGFPEHMVNDPNLVRQFLPHRNVNSVHVKGLNIAGKVRSGQPIPFTLDGAYPDASFEFSRFVITRENNVISIRPIGNSSGEPVPGLEIPVTLKGEIEPLEPGIYLIEFPELGPVGSYELIVE